VIDYFGDKLDFIVPGDVGNPGSVSDIIELTSNKVIRLG
jgi:tRNA A37 threonylcarbamoyladenosine synthetase subunit TsaC/SUA5/YrdC